jgi:branched-subunit amino acid transport protein AzlD
MSPLIYLLGAIVVLSLMCLLMRWLPFLLGGWLKGKETFMHLSRQLPIAIIAALVVYYIVMMSKPTHWHNLTGEVIGLIVTLLLQWYYRKTVISLLVGTGVYVLLQELG